MKRVNAIIIDDEVKSSENLEFLIQSYCKQVEITAIYNHPLEALEKLKTTAFDLLFLDVEMPQLDGFQLLELLENPADFKVIFTTAYKDYAIEAIKKSASDYLLKPINIQDLIKSVNKVITEVTIHKEKKTEKPQLLRIPSVHGFDLIQIQEINYLKSSNTTTEIFFTLDGVKKRVVSTKPLKHFEDLLQGYPFFRIHDSYVVNLNKIKQYMKGEGGSVMLHDGSEIDVSRRRKQDFLNLFLG